MLSQRARERLLDIARRSVEAAVRGEPAPKFDVQEPELWPHQGAFVTLRTHGRLRGCIGRFLVRMPLWEVTQQMARASATEDPRFFGMQLKPAELDALEIEISVLSPLERTDDPINQMELGKHGIYVKRGHSNGCFLPQVAAEIGWTKEEFLGQCCSRKAGLAPDAWKDADTEVYLFTAEVVEQR